MKRERGAASGFFCVEQGCSSRAAHWAYNGDDPNELLGKSRKGGKSWYSANVDAYEPMCAKCHATKDKAAASAELTEYRELKHDSGLTGSEIRELVEQYRNSSQKAVA